MIYDCDQFNPQCTLPSLYQGCLKSLIKYNPESKIIIWSNTLHDMNQYDNVQINNFIQESYLSMIPFNVRELLELLPNYFDTNVKAKQLYSDLLRLLFFGGEKNSFFFLGLLHEVGNFMVTSKFYLDY